MGGSIRNSLREPHRDGSPASSQAPESEQEGPQAATSSLEASSCSPSSGADFSARSSFRIESTLISQMRCFESVFLLSYSRLRNSPSTWICAPFFRVPANSESFPKTTQRCHSVCEMYLPSFL